MERKKEHYTKQDIHKERKNESNLGIHKQIKNYIKKEPCNTQ